jgi:hypothetical protein
LLAAASALPANPEPPKAQPGAMFRVELLLRTRLQKGRPVEGRLLEPIYAENRLLAPRGALLEGEISAVHPASRGKRLEAKFHGDFTPLAEPELRWTSIVRSDGTRSPLDAFSAGDRPATLYFHAPGSGKHASLLRRAWQGVMERKDSMVSTVSAPHKWERLQRFFWSQMPYHPQYLEEGTQYEMTLESELALASEAPPTASAEKPIEQMVTVRSRLQTELSSAKAKTGDPVEAVVTEPVFDAQERLIIPQESILHGRILRAQPSRSFGRGGELRFAFTQISFPGGAQQNVDAAPTAIEGRASEKMQLDREGGVVRQSDRAIAAPLVMGVLSASALGDTDGSAVGKAAVSANGFALVGRMAAIGIGSRYVGGAIGAAATARSIYTHWLAHGKETMFEKSTEVQLELSPTRAKRMKPVR